MVVADEVVLAVVLLAVVVAVVIVVVVVNILHLGRSSFSIIYRASLELHNSKVRFVHVLFTWGKIKHNFGEKDI